jgi:hypothetical protein
MSIMRKFRVPDGIMPIYPWTSLSVNQFSPSYLEGLYDPIICTSMLHLMTLAYMPIDKDQKEVGEYLYFSPG